LERVEGWRGEEWGMESRNGWFWRVELWNGKLFHVEQLEIGRND